MRINDMTLVAMPVNAVRLNGTVPTAVSLASACAGSEGTRVFGTGVSSCVGAWTGLVASAGQVVETVESVRARAAKLFALKPLAASLVEQPVLVGGSGHEQGLSVLGYASGQQQDRPETVRPGTNGNTCTSTSTSTSGNNGTDGNTGTNGTNPIDPWELRVSSPPG